MEVQDQRTRMKRLVPNVITSGETLNSLTVLSVAVLNTLLENVMQKFIIEYRIVTVNFFLVDQL